MYKIINMQGFIHNTLLICTEHQDVTALELLSRLLYSRGFGKNALLIKRFEVSYIKMTDHRIK